MKVILVLLIASVVVAGGFLLAFLWAVRNGQYDDTVTPSLRMLRDEAPAPDSSNSTKGSSSE
jgi:cbb3-type cytochrome oxidase maturation protein